ncbi:SulP family inorganic anion transporter [Caenimonas sp. SL110]|uniref:SulP family inorganic anion transporter n=1 Tax=Caenimonas sp. SL110 TaxID=1450524 RepID=UPI0009E25ADC|nr:sulfate permease [Caenimonas sp. SL110]
MKTLLSARTWLPSWIAGYDRGKAAQDAVAGIVVTILLVPQSLAYAMLAGLPAHVGMYASLLPLLAYAVLGSSMTLSVGPVAVASLMTAAAVTPLAVAGSADYVLLSMLLALIGGVVLLLLGVLRMGFVANLLSHPVISGFVTGSAVLIAIGQLKPLLGVPAKGDTALELLVSLVSHAGQLHLPTAILGVSSAAALWASRRFLAQGLRSMGLGAKTADIVPKLAPMVVVLVAIAAVAAFALDTGAGIAVVGVIPAGLPRLAVTMPTMPQLQALAVPAVMIALIGFVESVSVAQSLAIKRGERINPDAELRGLGAANLASALSGGFPVTGGFARSGVNFAAGARSPLAGVVAAALMALVLLGLTGLFERLPLAVLAATIIVAVVGLIDIATLRHAWHYDRADAVAWLVTAIGVLGLGVEAGVGLGVAMSIGTFLWRASRPHMAVVGRVGESEHFRNERRFSVRTYPGLLLLRVDESLFFANIPAVVRRIEEEIARLGDVRHLVLDLSSVGHIDLTAVEALQRLHSDLRERGIQMHLAEVRGPVMDRLKHTSLPGQLVNKPFLSLHEAIGLLAGEGSTPRLSVLPAVADGPDHSNRPKA